MRSACRHTPWLRSSSRRWMWKQVDTPSRTLYHWFPFRSAVPSSHPWGRVKRTPAVTSATTGGGPPAGVSVTLGPRRESIPNTATHTRPSRPSFRHRFRLSPPGG